MARQGPSWIAYGWLLSSCLLCACLLRAQPATADLLLTLRSTSSSSTARQCLGQLWKLDSLQVYLVADAALSAFENTESPLNRNQVDTLARIYAIGRQRDPNGPRPWLVRRALLAYRHQDVYGQQVLRWTMEAIEAAPQDVPSFLLVEAGEKLRRDYAALRLSLNAAAHYWALLDRALLQRQVGDSEEASAWSQLKAHLTLDMRSTLPDCQQLFGNFADAIAMGNLPPDACETFLIVYDLQGCDQPALWEASFSGARKAGDNAWLFRLAGKEAFNRGLHALSRDFWQRACSLEKSAALQANDQLQIAITYREAQDYRRARLAIAEAMRLHPNWGEPYVHLMDLYLIGSEACAMSSFEHKALYWLLLELCHQLRSVDANYALEADLRYYQYLQSCPTLEEAAFHGWRLGDTYPLKCWMSTVTTVRNP